MASTYIENVGTGDCVSGGADGRDKKLEVIDCNDILEADYWVLHNNGEVLSKYSRWCWDTPGSNGKGWAGMKPCDAKRDQIWDLIFLGGSVQF